MKIDNLRLTGLYFWAGQLFTVILSVLLGTPTRSFWIWQGAFALLCLILIFVFNWHYWFLRKPRWETNFVGWVKTCTKEEMTKYLEALEYVNKGMNIEPIKINFTQGYWGHVFNITDSPQDYIHRGYGFYSPLINGRRLKKGDTVLKKTESGRIGRFIVIDITYCNDPSDQFFAYVVGIGYEEVTNN